MSSDDKELQQRTNVSRWQSIDSQIPTPGIKANLISNNHLNAFPPPLSSTALPSLINVTLPSLVNPPTQTAAGLLASPNLQSLLGEMPGLLKNPTGGPPFFAIPPNFPPLGIFDAHDQRQSLSSALIDFFPRRQHQNFLPPNQLLAQQSIDFANAFIGNHQKNTIPPLNNTVLNQLANRQQENCLTQKEDLAPSEQQPIPVPVPPLPPSSSSMESLIVPPPPPPTRVQFARQNSQYLADSPMDIEDDQDEVVASEKEGNSKECGECKGRNKKVQMADELMKRALRPYFKRRRITKDEYKEIMKKGVAKLKKRRSLKAEKVEHFVSKYVQLVSVRRTNQRFGN